MNIINRNLPVIILKSLLISCLVLSITTKIFASDYLNSSETAIIGLASGGVGLIGIHVNNIPDNKKPVIRGHIPFEESFQRWLGGSCKLGKQNFLDDHFGSAITPVTSILLLTTANLSYPRDNKSKDVSQDLFLFISGIIATKGITDITKGIFTRERPFHHILDNASRAKSEYSYSYSQQSFFSGHTSGAFFAVSYLNLRLRDIMRQRMTKYNYDFWKWVSSGTLFSWASVVGLSRVHAYKHHLSDVIVGATAGILISELFYSFNNNSNNSSGNNDPTMFQVRITF